MGIRMALGARGRDVVAMVVGIVLPLTLAGIAIGVVLAMAATRLMSSLPFGVRSMDPITFAAVVVILVTMALLAAFLSACGADGPDGGFAGSVSHFRKSVMLMVRLSPFSSEPGGGFVACARYPDSEVER